MMRHRSVCFVSLVVITFAYIFVPTPAVPEQEHPAVWIWSGATIPTGPPTTLYIHQATVRKSGRTEFSGLGATKLEGSPLFMVIRLEMLPQAESLSSMVAGTVGRWRVRGNKVVGVQLDFDSPTGQLGPYAEFLEGFRRELPADLQLSITGLADWASQAAPADLERLALTTDEIAFQLYTGRKPIAYLSTYVSRLQLLSIPFKLGILPEMSRDEVVLKLFKHKLFRGLIVFPLPRNARKKINSEPTCTQEKHVRSDS